MMFDRRIANGLAWGGLFLVIAVPLADFATSSLTGKVAVPVMSVSPKGLVAVTADAIDEPRVMPAAQEVAVTPVTPQSPLDRFTQSGKKLPSYISDEAAPVALTEPVDVAPEETATTAPAMRPKAKVVIKSPTTEVAAIRTPTPEPEPEVLFGAPPVPMPVSARPLPPPVTELATVEVTERLTTPDAAEPLILPEPKKKPRKPKKTVAQAESRNFDEMVGPEELAEWESGTLSDFLAERRGSQVTFEEGFDDPSLFSDDQVENSGEFFVFD